VFLLDPDFKIERPKRYYRQGLKVFHPDLIGKSKDKENRSLNTRDKADENATVRGRGSIGSRLSRAFHFHVASADGVGDHSLSPTHHRSESESSGSSESSSIPSRSHSPMQDPSTIANPLAPRREDDSDHSASDKEKKRKKRGELDISRHTFYIENSQMRLKLFARNEVRNSLV
jgi:phospholipase D1/2